MPKTVKDIRRENLAKLIEEAGSKVKLAAMTGTHRVYIGQVMSDADPRALGDAVARRIEKGMSKPFGWMDHTHGRREERHVIWCPIIEWAQILTDQRPTQRVLPVQAVIRDAALSPAAYVLEVRNDLMQAADGSSPTYQLGSFIVVDPDRGAKPNDRVIATVPGSDEPVFKQYLADGPHRYLRNLNTRHSKQIDFGRGVKIVGVVVATYFPG